MTAQPDAPFWKRKTLDEMTRDEWESLCDGCARCCLHKLEDEDTGEIAYTNVTCRLLDLKTCRCTRYAERKRLVPDCVVLDPEKVHELPWMPTTCAYRLLAEGQDLPWWHPLVSGDPETVRTAGIAVSDFALSERDAGDLHDHIIAISD
ncbi:MAG: YcgN family cysteine cluster protein [Alphaproteobacteria bacterium]|nr:MAG: YcgN family cysteine cluster protein [Alphaproteobacteria bacterium]